MNQSLPIIPSERIVSFVRQWYHNYYVEEQKDYVWLLAYAISPQYKICCLNSQGLEMGPKIRWCQKILNNSDVENASKILSISFTNVLHSLKSNFWSFIKWILNLYWKRPTAIFYFIYFWNVHFCWNCRIRFNPFYCEY